MKKVIVAHTLHLLLFLGISVYTHQFYWMIVYTATLCITGLWHALDIMQKGTHLPAKGMEDTIKTPVSKERQESTYINTYSEHLASLANKVFSIKAVSNKYADESLESLKEFIEQASLVLHYADRNKETLTNDNVRQVFSIHTEKLINVVDTIFKHSNTERGADEITKTCIKLTEVVNGLTHTLVRYLEMKNNIKYVEATSDLDIIRGMQGKEGINLQEVSHETHIVIEERAEKVLSDLQKYEDLTSLYLRMIKLYTKYTCVQSFLRGEVAHKLAASLIDQTESLVYVKKNMPHSGTGAMINRLDSLMTSLENEITKSPLWRRNI